MARSLRRFIAAAAAAGALLSVISLRSDAQQQQQQQEQQQPPDQQQPVFRTGINFVRVDVIVSDRNGTPVGDLKQTDFEVTEDNKPQAIETFKLVRLDGGTLPGADGPPRAIRTDADEELEAARDDVRLFAIFLDDYHVRRGASMTARNPVSEFIQSQLGPSDMLGVMYPLQPVSAVRMTRNHDAVIRAIQQFAGRKYDYTPRNEFEEQYARYPAEIVEQVRNQVSLSAIRGLITHMGSLKEGRKALIVVSEGYTSMLPPQLRDPVATMPGYGNPAAGNPMAGANDPNEERAAFFANMDVLRELREVYDTANRNNVAIYTVDPRGLPGFEFDIDEGVGMQLDKQYLNSTMDTLRILAEETDGRAIVNRNDLALGMKQIMRDSSAYYLLGYNSTQALSDGKFHEIKVRVKRPGVQVRARRGYWALTAEDTARALAPKVVPPKAVENALAAIGQPSSARVIRTWIGTSRGANGKTKVTFVWEPIPTAPGDRNLAGADMPARVSLMAVGSDGAPYFRGRVPDVALASASPGPATAGGAARARSPSRVAFEVDPGQVQLRVSVEGTSSQVLDTDIREITVPDLNSPNMTVLGTPEVLRARTVREYQQLKADPDAVQTPSREFTRTDRLLIRVPAYGPGTAPPPVTAHLLNRAGKPMMELLAAPSDVPGRQTIDLPLAGFAAGEYIIEIKAQGGDEAKELVGFRVAS